MEIERNIPSGYNVTSPHLTSGRLVMAFSTSGCIVEGKGMMHEKLKIEKENKKEEKDRKKARTEERAKCRKVRKQESTKKIEKERKQTSNVLRTELRVSHISLGLFKRLLLQYYKRGLDLCDIDDIKTWRIICPKCSAGNNFSSLTDKCPFKSSFWSDVSLVLISIIN